MTPSNRSRAALLVVGAVLASCAIGPGTSGPPSTTGGPGTSAGSSPLPDLTPAGSPTPVPGASALPEDGVFRTILVQGDGSGELPIVLQDLTGLVTGIGPVQPGVPFPGGAPFEDGVANPEGQQDVLTYRWTGGACDVLTSITFERIGAGRFRLSSATKTTGGACILIGIGRGIDIHLAEPVEAHSVVVDNG